MSCNCFSSSELFILAGWVGNKRKGGRGKGYTGGGGRRSKMPVACGFTTRKLDLLPLLLLQARRGRVRSSPRTYSAARAASPAGGRRGRGEGGDLPAARGQKVGAREAPAVALRPQPLPYSLRLPVQLSFPSGDRHRRFHRREDERACVFTLAHSCSPFLRLHPHPGHQNLHSGENRPWICSVHGNPTLNAAQGPAAASRPCRTRRNGQ